MKISRVGGRGEWRSASEAKQNLILGFQKILSGPCGNQGVDGWGTHGGECIRSSEYTFFTDWRTQLLLLAAEPFGPSCKPWEWRTQRYVAPALLLGAYWNTQASNWQEHWLTGKQHVNSFFGKVIISETCFQKGSHLRNIFKKRIVLSHLKHI